MVRAGVRPRKLVDWVVEEDLRSELYVGRVSEEGGSSSTGDGSISCIGTEEMEPRVEVGVIWGRSGLEDIVEEIREVQ